MDSHEEWSECRPCRHVGKNGTKYLTKFPPPPPPKKKMKAGSHTFKVISQTLTSLIRCSLFCRLKLTRSVQTLNFNLDSEFPYATLILYSQSEQISKNLSAYSMPVIFDTFLRLGWFFILSITITCFLS